MSSYLIFYDLAQQDDQARTPKQAIEALYGFLNRMIIDHVDRNTEGLSTYFVGLEENIKDDLKQISKKDAEYYLVVHNDVQLYAVSESDGVIAAAAAVLVGLKARKPKPKEPFPYSKKHSNRFCQHRYIANCHVNEYNKTIGLIQQMVSQSSEDPIGVSPIMILEAAEDRIFAHNLYRAMKNSKFGWNEIEDRAKLTSGTIDRIISAFNPLHASRDMRIRLAQALEVEESDLWYDAVLSYQQTLMDQDIRAGAP